ncbi:hypothetical protein SARC_02371 [Sphaeroforma arctica JP610]|uniref:Uncharacterized protein n=1 Tax=Sphaeroforma arctica JP610 TaxID=667725 RepID=A0A0L0G8W0_9EUKA|nr:hypothetical protein SARC_02371 [Sphaeroforma arctica JP610]KNC85467.1 hypothetical protein SARC_02371 [Sphaeroforma arctica JP610]|eukprot:XP_014159369.1 hypothetical protein SARC_02371 [Sphaeroforma arctica JP610]
MATPNCTILWVRFAKELLRAESQHFNACSDLINTICVHIVQPLLDSSPSVTIATCLVEILVLITNSSASINLALYLPDIADVVLGWYLDETTPAPIREGAMLFYTSSALQWRVRLDVTVAHINQILTDMMVVANSIASKRNKASIRLDVCKYAEQCMYAQDMVTHLAPFATVLSILIQAIADNLGDANFTHPALPDDTQQRIYDSRQNLTQSFIETAILARGATCFATTVSVLVVDTVHDTTDTDGRGDVPESVPVLSAEEAGNRQKILPVVLKIHDLISAMCDLVDPVAGVSKRISSSLLDSLIATADVLGDCCCYANRDRVTIATGTTMCYCSGGVVVAGVLSTCGKVMRNLLGNSRTVETSYLSAYEQLWGRDSLLWKLRSTSTPLVVMQSLTSLWRDVIGHAENSLQSAERVWSLLGNDLHTCTRAIVRMGSVCDYTIDTQKHRSTTGAMSASHATRCAFTPVAEGVGVAQSVTGGTRTLTYTHAQARVAQLSVCIAFDCYVVGEVLMACGQRWLLHDSVVQTLVGCLSVVPDKQPHTHACAPTHLQRTGRDGLSYSVFEVGNAQDVAMATRVHLLGVSSEAYLTLMRTLHSIGHSANFYLPTSPHAHTQDYTSTPYRHIHAHAHTHAHTHTRACTKTAHTPSSARSLALSSSLSSASGMGAVLSVARDALSDATATREVLLSTLDVLRHVLGLVESAQALSEKDALHSRRALATQPLWQDVVSAVADHTLSTDVSLASLAVSCITLILRLHLTSPNGESSLANHIACRLQQAATHTNSELRESALLACLTSQRTVANGITDIDTRTDTAGVALSGVLRTVLQQSAALSDDPRLLPMATHVPEMLRIVPELQPALGVDNKGGVKGTGGSDAPVVQVNERTGDSVAAESDVQPHTDTHTDADTATHTDTLTHTGTDTHTHTGTDIHTHTDADTQGHTHTDTQGHTHTDTGAETQADVYTDTQASGEGYGQAHTDDHDTLTDANGDTVTTGSTDALATEQEAEGAPHDTSTRGDTDTLTGERGSMSAETEPQRLNGTDQNTDTDKRTDERMDDGATDTSDTQGNVPTNERLSTVLPTDLPTDLATDVRTDLSSTGLPNRNTNTDTDGQTATDASLDCLTDESLQAERERNTRAQEPKV